jgi:hypothetical protein
LAPLPAFTIEALRVEADGTPAPLGDVDLTRVLLSRAIRVRDRPPVLPAAPPTNLMASDGVPRPVLEASWDGRLTLVAHAERQAAFVDGIGGAGMLPLLRQAYERLDSALAARDEAERLLADVRAAATVPGAEGDFIFDPYAEAYERDPAQAYRDWPSAGAPAGGEAAFRGIRGEAPPYLFATRDEPWGGLTAERVREDAENAREVEGGPVDPSEMDVRAMLECELETHFEEAIEHLVEPGRVEAIVRDWLPHAGDGSPGDLRLEADLAAWNALQDIVSHYADRTRIVLLRGADKAAAESYCVRALAEAQRAVGVARDAWVPEPAAA